MVKTVVEFTPSHLVYGVIVVFPINFRDLHFDLLLKFSMIPSWKLEHLFQFEHLYEKCWHLLLFSIPWAYWTLVKTTAGFTPFHLVYVVKVGFPINFRHLHFDLLLKFSMIPPWKLEHLFQLEHLYEKCCDFFASIEAMKRCTKVGYDSHVKPLSFGQGDLIVVYDFVMSNFSPLGRVILFLSMIKPK